MQKMIKKLGHNDLVLKGVLFYPNILISDVERVDYID